MRDLLDCKQTTRSRTYLVFKISTVYVVSILKKYIFLKVLLT